MTMGAGAITPPHKGHGELLRQIEQDAKKSGRAPVFAVSKGANRTEDVGLSIKEKIQLSKLHHPDVHYMSTQGFQMPEVTRMGGNGGWSFPS